MPEGHGGVGGLRPPLERLLRLYAVETVEQRGLERIFCRRQVYQAGSEVLTNADGRGPTRVILSGWAVRTRLLSDGRRQIISFLIPGDIVSLLQRAEGWASTTVTAITPLEAAEVGDLFEATTRTGGDSPLVRACAIAAAREDNLLLNQVVRLGLQGASERMAHLFLELSDRLKRVGMTDGETFRLPLKQEHLAEALGMSLVHANRTIQRLRAEKMIELRASVLTILQPGRLAQHAQYEPPRLLAQAG